jgi:ParB-like nuclease domain
MTALAHAPQGEADGVTTIGWRKYLKIHPAAELFPRLPADELRALGEDIKAHGLQHPVVLWRDADGGYWLLDGRNRLDAMEDAGTKLIKRPDATDVMRIFSDVSMSVVDVNDPVAYVISANIRRRHLSDTDRTRLVAELIKLNPLKSNRQIAKETKTSHPKVARVRADLEERGDVERRTTSVDTLGREQPAHKQPPSLAATTAPPASTPEPTPPPKPPTPTIAAEPTTDIPPWVPPPLPPSSRLDPTIVWLGATRHQLESQTLPYAEMYSDSRRQRLKEVWLQAISCVREAIGLVEADRDEQREAERVSALGKSSPPTQPADGHEIESHADRPTEKKLIKLSSAILRAVLRPPDAHLGDMKWLTRFSKSIGDYALKYQRLRSGRSSMTQTIFDDRVTEIGVPVRTAWGNLTPDLQGRIAEIAKTNGSAAELVEIVGELPEPEPEVVPANRDPMW